VSDAEWTQCGADLCYLCDALSMHATTRLPFSKRRISAMRCCRAAECLIAMLCWCLALPALAEARPQEHTGAQGHVPGSMGYVVGTVRAPTGSVRRAEVVLFVPGSLQILARSKTDDLGRYRLNAMSVPFECRVAFVHADCHQAVSDAFRLSAAPGTVIHMTLRPASIKADAVSWRLSTLTGRVTMADTQRAVPAAFVKLVGPTGHYWSTHANGQGVYAFHNVPGRNGYQLTAAAEGCDVSSGGSLDLRQGATRYLDVQLRPFSAAPWMTLMLGAAQTLQLPFPLFVQHAPQGSQQMRDSLRLWLFGETPGPRSDRSSSVVGAPSLQVQGNRLVQDGGKPVVLRGVAVGDPYALRRSTIENFHVIAAWGADIVRIPIHPGFFQRNARKYLRMLERVVNEAESVGLYVLLDWHAIGCPLCRRVPPLPFIKRGETSKELYNPSLELALRAWKFLARRFRSHPAVLYEICNEPEDVGCGHLTWERWRKVVEMLVDQIRSQAPDAVAFVAGLRAATQLREAATDPVRRPNIVYVVHSYPSSFRLQPLEAEVGAVCTRYPVFASEWGFISKLERDFPALYGTRADYGEPLLAYLKSRGIGWTAWIWHPQWRPPLLRNWYYEPTEFGLLVLEALRVP